VDSISLIKILICNSGGMGRRAVLIISVVVRVAQIAILMHHLLRVQSSFVISNNQILAL
jgi:hypothetical protein